ncbi:sensor histidine kinase [Massilia arenosa]|uniref:Sensor histidine kinase n=1 Tax=Zemynaea arenosa TaxID=2561931 RepID=A0A4Y9SE30_9BURK|nr:sensor histidine kinase [Massilia arenosa]TFW21045.1 sensor histidine kinase [Massilia arenosa]
MRWLRWPWVPAEFGKAPYLWLLTINFFFWKYIGGLPSWTEAGMVVLTFAAFLAAYFSSFWRRDGQRVLLCILAVCLIGVLWVPFNPGANVFFIFASGMCAGFVQRRNAYAALIGVMLLAAVSAANSAYPVLNFLIPSVCVGLPVGIGSIMEAQVRRSRAKLLRTQEEVEHMATIAERERISRDLHDLLGHTLSLITLKAELAGKLVARDVDAAAREIRDIEQTARKALSEVRSAVTGYRQAGFTYELDSARHSLAAANITLDARVDPLAMPPAVENVMSLALREAVTNIVRHARAATRCDVTLAVEHGTIVLRIADDGGAADAGRIRAGNGLTGMQERVRALGGKIVLSGGRGLSLELALPMGSGA